jgi:hypothetical protein
MRRKYKSRKIKPAIRKIKRAFTEMWRKEYEEKYLKEQLMQNLKTYFTFDAIEKQETENDNEFKYIYNSGVINIDSQGHVCTD